MEFVKKVALFYNIQRANFLSRKMYSVNFYVGISSIVILSIGPIINLRILTDHFGTIGGWTFLELILMYSIWRISHGLFSIFWMHQLFGFDSIVRNGEFDSMLVRPHHPLFMLATSRFNIAGIGDMFIGTIGIIWAFIGLKLHWYHILTIIPIGVMGALITTCIFLIISTTSFWTLQSDGIRDIVNRFNLTFHAYPIHIYNLTIQVILSFVLPFAFTAYYPTQLILNRNTGTVFWIYIPYFTPVVVILLVVFALVFWSLGSKNYKSSGS